MKHIFYLFFASFSVQCVSAQTMEASPILKKLVNQSFSYFPSIKEVENRVTTAQKQAELTAIQAPDISFSAAYTYVAPVAKVDFPINGETKSLQFQPNHNYTTGVYANYLLFDFGRLKAGIEKSRQEVALAKSNVDATKLQLAYQVAVIWYNIAYYQKAISLQDSIIASLQESKRIAQKRLDNGDALRIDVLNLQSAIDNELNRKVDLQNNLTKQIQLMQYSAGNVPANIAATLVATPSIVDTVNLWKATQQQNPDVAIIDHRIKSAQSEVALLQLKDKPTVSLNALSGIRNGYQPNIGKGIVNYAAGISFNMPIYSGGRAKKQVEIAQNEVKQQELALQSANERIKKDLQQAFADVQSNLERLQHIQEQLIVAQTAESLAKSRFKNGAATNVEVVNAAANTQRVWLNNLQYQYQLSLAQLELAKLSGFHFWE